MGKPIKAEPALMFDSVHAFARGLAALDRSHVLRPANLSCELEQPWDDGLSLYNYINAVSGNKVNQTILSRNLLITAASSTSALGSILPIRYLGIGIAITFFESATSTALWVNPAINLSKVTVVGGIIRENR
ncbi:hypothetical protein J437_LFUL006129 [Ladona fulva]|uniref:Uncharacterized protein n=1 Tax=Ladona fulva TaxID=123851 RepID=A0A8K0K1H4_LADFU|nr:hypothetical protein J437_LFUL006129 [Ladona fulva]